MGKYKLLLVVAILFVGCGGPINNITNVLDNKQESKSSLFENFDKKSYQRHVDYKSDSDITLKLNTSGHTSVVRDIIFTKNKEIITASYDKFIKVWNLKGEEKRKILGYIGGETTGQIAAIALSPDEKYLAVGGLLNYKHNSEWGNIRIYDYKSGKLVKVFKAHSNTVTKLKFTPEGNYLVSGGILGWIKTWNVKKGFTLHKKTKMYDTAVNDMLIYKEGKNNYVVSVAAALKDPGGFVTIYSINTDEPHKVYKRRDSSLQSVSRNPQNGNIAINCYYCVLSKDIQILDKNLNLLKKVVVKNTNPAGVAYSPDGKYMIVGSRNQKGSKEQVNIFNTDDYSLKTTFNKHQGITANVGFVTIKDKLYAYSSGGWNNAINIWDINSGQIKTSIVGNSSEIINVELKNNSILWGITPDYKNPNNRGPVEHTFNIDNSQIQYNVNNSYKNEKTTNGLYSLSTSNNRGVTNAILNISKLGITQASILKDMYSGKQHRAYGWYKDYIVTSGSHGYLDVYTKDGYPIAKLLGHIGDVFAIDIQGDVLISASEQIIKVWNLKKLTNDVQKLNFRQPSAFNKDWRDYVKKNFPGHNITTSNGIENLFYKLYKDKQYNTANRLIEQDFIYPSLSLFVGQDNEWIAWTEEGYFNASPNGHKYIGFHLNRGYDKEAHWVGIDKLYDHFYRPDLVKLALQGEDITKYTNGLTYKDVLKNPPPSVKMLKANNQRVKGSSIKHTKDSIDLEFNVKSIDGGGVGLIRVYQEGKLVQTIGNGKVKRESANVIENINEKKMTAKAKKDQEKYLASLSQTVTKSINGTVNIDELVERVKADKTKNRTGKYKISLPLKAGKNNIAIEAFNKTNTVASIKESITIDAKIKRKTPTTYAIVAGVNEFENTGRLKNLKYSENDAKAIKDILNNSIKGKVVVKYLVGDKLTKENLYKAVKDIKAKAGLEDRVIFYISTHGKAIRGNMYLVPHNNKRAKNWIKFEELFKNVQSINALEQVFIVDACESGKAKDIVASIYDSKASVLAKQSGVHVLLATAKGTYAFEHNDPSIKHGVFTYNILKALNDRKTDNNRDKKISVIELSKVLRSPEYVTNEQVPVIRNVGADTKMRDF